MGMTRRALARISATAVIVYLGNCGLSQITAIPPSGAVPRAGTRSTQPNQEQLLQYLRNVDKYVAAVDEQRAREREQFLRAEQQISQKLATNENEALDSLEQKAKSLPRQRLDTELMENVSEYIIPTSAESAKLIAELEKRGRIQDVRRVIQVLVSRPGLCKEWADFINSAMKKYPDDADFQALAKRHLVAYGYYLEQYKSVVIANLAKVGSPVQTIDALIFEQKVDGSGQRLRIDVETLDLVKQWSKPPANPEIRAECAQYYLDLHGYEECRQICGDLLKQEYLWFKSPNGDHPAPEAISDGDLTRAKLTAANMLVFGLRGERSFRMMAEHLDYLKGPGITLAPGVKPETQATEVDPAACPACRIERTALLNILKLTVSAPS